MKAFSLDESQIRERFGCSPEELGARRDVRISESGTPGRWTVIIRDISPDRPVPTYEEWLRSHERYDGSCKCFIPGCDRPGLYEGGDARFTCPMCAEHAGLDKEEYRRFKELHKRN